MAFWAYGIDNDYNHMPWPHPLALVSPVSHTFRVFKVNRTSCYWAMAMDQGLPDYAYATVPGGTTTWTPTAAQVGNEVWNCGDQIGGAVDAPQHFWNESLTDGTGATRYFLSNPAILGHCYPEAVWGPGPHGYDWSSWTLPLDRPPC